MSNPLKPSVDMTHLKGLLDKYKLEDKGGYITKEYQDFGFRIAMELNDKEHKSLYIKLAKTENRVILEKALSFVKDSNARNPARLFMWKLKQLRETKKAEAPKQLNLLG